MFHRGCSEGCSGLSFMTMLVPPGARGGLDLCGFLSDRVGETLAREDCGGMAHCKGLVTSSRPLTFGSEWWHRRLPTKLEKSCHVGKVYHLCRVLWTIRIAVSTVMDMLAKPLQVRFWFWFQKILWNDCGFLIQSGNWAGMPCDRRVSFTTCWWMLSDYKT